MSFRKKAQILDSEAIARSLTRVAHEIIEQNPQLQTLALIGIRTRGAVIAERLAHQIETISGHALEVGILDITLYRDDLSTSSPNPVVRATEINFDITDRLLVLVDDVLYTGRTTRSALNAINDLGRPKAIRLAVLIDRGHRELPIKADYVGKNVPTASQERVHVKLLETDQDEEVILEEPDQSVTQPSGGR